MKRKCRTPLFVILLTLLITLLLTACGTVGKSENGQDANGQDQLTTIEELNDFYSGKTIGVVTGSLTGETARRELPDAQVVEFSNVSDLVAALKAHRIDAFVTNTFNARELSKDNADIGAYDIPLFSIDCGFIVNLSNEKLKEEINETLARIREDGTYDALTAKWIDGSQDDWTMPDTSALSGENGTIRIATTGTTPPFTTVVNGQNCGFDLEILYEVARDHGYSVEYLTVDFGGLVSSVASGKADIGAATIGITQERAKQVAFSDPYLQNGHLLVYLEEGDAAESSFFSKVQDSFYNNFIVEERWKMVLEGIKITILISLGAIFFGTLLGFAMCFARMSTNAFLHTLAKVYIRIMEGTPILVFLMILYYIFFKNVPISAIWVAIVAFAMSFGAYAAEIFRSGIEGVEKGQTEAALAMGVSRSMTFFKIVLPQAAQSFLPVYKGQVVSIVKSTSVVGYIAIQDLTKVSDIIRSRTYDAFFPLIMIAVIYFLLTYLMTLLIGAVEIQVRPKRMSKKGENADD